MPIYTYRCENCLDEFDINQGIKQKPLKKCKKCKKNKLERLLYAPMGFVRQEATTIGQLAERNDKTIGKYKKEELEVKNEGLQKSKEVKEKRELHKKLNKMTPEQQTKYIHTGKL